MREFMKQPILDVEANLLPNGNIRLKFLAIAGDIGPELTMPRTLAQLAIQKLEAALAVKA